MTTASETPQVSTVDVLVWRPWPGAALIQPLLPGAPAKPSLAQLREGGALRVAERCVQVDAGCGRRDAG